jgi:hypothetical protein
MCTNHEGRPFVTGVRRVYNQRIRVRRIAICLALSVGPLAAQRPPPHAADEAAIAPSDRCPVARRARAMAAAKVRTTRG